MTETIDISREDSGAHGAYRSVVPGTDEVAELTWRAHGGARIADHTYTPPAARGKGIAAKLVEAMVADARRDGFAIVPQCPYVEALFRRHPEWADLKA